MMPFPSLLGLLQCHCHVELPQSRGERMSISCTADLGQALWRGQRQSPHCQHQGLEQPQEQPAPARPPCLVLDSREGAVCAHMQDSVLHRGDHSMVLP